MSCADCPINDLVPRLCAHGCNFTILSGPKMMPVVPGNVLEVDDDQDTAKDNQNFPPLMHIGLPNHHEDAAATTTTTTTDADAPSK